MKNNLTITSILLLAFTFISLEFASCQSPDTDGEKLKAVYEMYDNYKENFPAARDISPSRAMKLYRQRKVIFIDVRPLKERKVSMLPGAITQKEYLENFAVYKHKTAVAYCTISYRSGLFSEKQTKGGKVIFNLRGGLLAWVLEGGKVYDMKGTLTKTIHVYGRRWDYPPKGYTSVR